MTINGSLTGLVSSVTQTGGNCGYSYDDNGNIASATLNGKWTGYTYDALGQLIQVNDHSDTRSGADGTTWKYTYDLGGNILKKERFAYADTTTPLETVTYEYGDANWRDKLTAVNGSTIRYDAIGNPLSDGTWTYTWENGRQLARMQSANMDAKFVYNENGLRVQKIVNGVVTDYVLHGKNVVHMTKGNDELHIFYDAQNRPALVVYNGVPYAYVKNLQGDIVAILDASGNVVVSYVYDAWGKPIACSGVMADTLGKVNPFRYRGYVYDEETGLYYLQSRYYNARLCRFVNSDSLIAGNLFAYCYCTPVCMADTSGKEPTGEFDLDNTTYSLPIEQLSAEDIYFNENYLLRIAYFLMAPTDYDYHSTGFREAKYDVCGFCRITKGHSDCSHLMRAITGSGSNTAKYRYTGFKGNKGKLLDKNGNFTVTLKQGMEVFKASGENKYGHVGMLILYDFGDGLEWAVFQSAAMPVTRSKAVFLDDSNGGPNITALFDKNGKCTWTYYIDPYPDIMQ